MAEAETANTYGKALAWATVVGSAMAMAVVGNMAETRLEACLRRVSRRCWNQKTV